MPAKWTLLPYIMFYLYIDDLFYYLIYEPTEGHNKYHFTYVGEGIY